MKRLIIFTFTIFAFCSFVLTASAQSDPLTIPQSEWSFPTGYSNYKELKTIDGANYLLDTPHKLASFIGFPEVNNDTEYTIPGSVEYDNEAYTVVAVCYGSTSYASSSSSSQSKVSRCVKLSMAASIRYIDLSYLCVIFPYVEELTMSEHLETLYRAYDQKKSKILNFTSPTPPQYNSPGFYASTYLRINVPEGTYDAYNTMLSKAWSSYSSYICIVDGGKLTSNVNDFQINVPEPGKLSDEIKSYIGSATKINGLSVNGTLNTADFTTLRSCKKLLRLDLSNIICKNDVMLNDLSFLEELQLPKNLGVLAKQALQNDISLKRLTLPEGVTSIGDNALYNCKSLKEVDLPASLVSIGKTAFNNCTSLTNVTLPANLEVLGTGAFQGCTSLPGITLPENITEVPGNTFNGCTSLSDVKLASKTTSIGLNAFRSAKLTELTLPATLEEVGEQAFMDNTALKTVNFNPTLKAIKSNAFNGCTSLLSVDLPDAVTELGSGAFEYCSALTDARIGRGITTISNVTFYKASALQNVTLPEGIRIIESQAFQDTGLKDITLPSSVSYIGTYALDCPSLQHITCQSLLPPETTESTFGTVLMGRGISNASLTVPTLSVLGYQSHPYWGDAYAVKPSNVLPQQVNISGKALLSYDGADTDSEESASYHPDVHLYHDGLASDFICDFDVKHAKSYGQLTIDEGTTLHVGTLEYQVGNRERELNILTDFYTTLINRGYMHVDKTIANISLVGAKQWHFISLPFNTKVAGITPNPFDADIALRRYDGVARGGGRTEWVEVKEGEDIRAGEPIALYFVKKNGSPSNTLELIFQSTDDSADYWSNEDKTVNLNLYQSMLECDANWNFVGNPYPSYYDIYYLRSAQPIITWNGTNYTAYSPLDDDYIMNPGEGFFVQRSESTPKLVFDKEGRQHCDHFRDNNMAQSQRSYSNKASQSQFPARQLRATLSHAERHVYDIVLANAIAVSENSDRTRIVFNPLASESYEADCDAPKFAAMSSYVPQISTYMQHDGITVNYAINERPATSEPINLKLSIPTDGNYKLRVSGKRGAKTEGIALVDSELGTTTLLQTDTEDDGSVSVTLPLLAGNYNQRFAIVFDSDEITGITTVNDNAAAQDADVYNIAGQRLSAPRKGINIKKNRKYIIK